MKQSKPVLLMGAALVVVLVACAGPPTTGENSPNPGDSPGATASAARTPTVTPSASALPSATWWPPPGTVRCETFPQQTYVNRDYGFSAVCPGGFWWRPFGDLPTGWRFMSSMVDDKQDKTYPEGLIAFAVLAFDSDTLRHWVDSHTGEPNDISLRYIWKSVSNLRDTTVGGLPAIAFDYVHIPPEGQGPMDTHAAAVVLKDGKNVLLVYWWAYENSEYAATIEKVANSVVGSITIS